MLNRGSCLCTLDKNPGLKTLPQEGKCVVGMPVNSHAAVGHRKAAELVRVTGITHPSPAYLKGVMLSPSQYTTELSPTASPVSQDISGMETEEL